MVSNTYEPVIAADTAYTVWTFVLEDVGSSKDVD